ncbi:MAG: hypothetical protein Kow0037_09930 [Calditrichia bacterium]
MFQKKNVVLSPLLLAEFSVKLKKGVDISEELKRLSAEELRAARDYFENLIQTFGKNRDGRMITRQETRANFEPIPNYYYKQDCREPLEACINETCLSSNPQCFSRKMMDQIEMLLEQLKPYYKRQ